MSVRSSRRLNNSSALLQEKNEPMSTKKTRKIRKTMDLICFDTTFEEIKKEEEKKTKISKKRKSDEDQENRPPSFKELSNFSKGPHKHSTDKAPLPPFNDKRKIVKAKRLLKNTEDDKHVNNPVDPVTEAERSLVVTTLPSPISPSADNTYNPDSLLLSKNLHFNSSREDLHPSTNGAVESSRRRTYELEDSIIDVSLLKTASEQDSSRLNSLPSSEFDTPTELKFSKVTMRRKWEKVENTPYKPSPNWINRKLKKSLSPLVLPETNTSRTLSKTLSPILQKVQTSSTKKYVSKVKLPNFAAIHQRALNKIESIDEYKVRKEKRAVMLLSGRKPEVVAPLSEKESRKQLRFAPDTSSKEKSPTFIPLPSTPLPKKKLNQSFDSPSTPVPFKWEPSKIPRFDCIQPDKKTPQKPVSKNNAIYKKFNFQNVAVEVKTHAFVPVNKVNVFQKTEIKNFIKKSKTEKNTVESRRYAIKGVRSNRRFELLMNMRKGK